MRILEQTVHGSESRAVKAKVDYLATVGEGMSKKVLVQENQLLSLVDTSQLQPQLQKLLREATSQNRELWAQCSSSEQELQSLLHATRSNNGAKELVAMIAELKNVEAENGVLKQRKL